MASTTPKKKDVVLIPHTHSAQDRELQLSDLRYHYHTRGGDVKNVEVQYLDDGTSNRERRETIQKWIDKNKDAFTFRNGVLTPCAEIQTRKPGVVKKKKKVTKTETKEKGGDA